MGLWKRDRNFLSLLLPNTLEWLNIQFLDCSTFWPTLDLHAVAFLWSSVPVEVHLWDGGRCCHSVWNAAGRHVRYAQLWLDVMEGRNSVQGKFCQFKRVQTQCAPVEASCLVAWMLAGLGCAMRLFWYWLSWNLDTQNKTEMQIFSATSLVNRESTTNQTYSGWKFVNLLLQVTGPQRAFSGNFYIYIEASSPRRLNDNARWALPWKSCCGQNTGKRALRWARIPLLETGQIYMGDGSKVPENIFFKVTTKSGHTLTSRKLIGTTFEQNPGAWPGVQRGRVFGVPLRHVRLPYRAARGVHPRRRQRSDGPAALDHGRAAGTTMAAGPHHNTGAPVRTTGEGGVAWSCFEVAWSKIRKVSHEESGILATSFFRPANEYG